MTITEPGADHQMRAGCPECGSTAGTISPINGQDVVRCAQCGRYCYNAPRTETGRPPRSLRARPQIPPSQSRRIFVRDRRTCLLCGRHDRPLVIGHIISVREGRAYGLSDAELYHDENLTAMCQSATLAKAPKHCRCHFWWPCPGCGKLGCSPPGCCWPSFGCGSQSATGRRHNFPLLRPGRELVTSPAPQRVSKLPSRTDLGGRRLFSYSARSGTVPQ